MDYARRLAAAAVPVEVDLVPGTVHGFDGLLPESGVAREQNSSPVKC
jgi:acetyl esterase/lipase